MTKTRFTNQKITKKIVLVILMITLSCNSLKKTADDNDYFISLLEEYIKSYKSYDLEKSLEVIMISTKINKGKIEYIINDAPKEVFWGELIKAEKSKDTSELFGYYKGFPCQMKSDSIQNYVQFFEKLDEDMMIQAKKSSKVKGSDGKEYNMDLSLVNWTPELIIIFDSTSKNNKKEILNE